MIRGLAAIAALFAVALPAAAHAQAASPAATAATPVDYADPANWLCRPGRQDACTVNLDSTVVEASGATHVERYHAAADPPIDCFYVYPTVSTDPGPNATMAIEPQETEVVKQQFARFGSRCRLYAPVYRQVTLTALRATMLGKPIGGDRVLAYRDVADAWREYLAHDNHGRGVVLIGHSQGSGLLTQLIKREIDGKPTQRLMVSAIVGGTNLPVPQGAAVGGVFQSVPTCHARSQTGCVIAFASFRATSPPPADSRFGKSAEPNTVSACVDPAALGGGSGPLQAYLSSGSDAIVASAQAPGPWTTPSTPITTPFVQVPGLLSAQCMFGDRDYLAITLHPDPAGHRTNEITGDVVVGGHVLKDWGLHLIDMNLTMGNLIDIVGAQTQAYLAAGGH